MLTNNEKNGDNGVNGDHQNEEGEDLYNYDEPSDGEIEDDDDEHNNSNEYEVVGDNGTSKPPTQPGHVIELKAAIDTDDEFHDNGRQDENGRGENSRRNCWSWCFETYMFAGSLR